jgi:hypothetical protein
MAQAMHPIIYMTILHAQEVERDIASGSLSGTLLYGTTRAIPSDGHCSVQ